MALTGEVGTGKTTLCQCLLQQLPDEVDLALVLNPKLSAVDLLATICDELAVSYDKYRQTLKHLVDRLNHHLLAAHAKGRRTVLMIDEAQNLSFDVLEQIRLLTNLETSKSKLLQIILVGQPELQQLLAQPKLRQLNQRINARYHLLPLNRAETSLYIKHRLAVSHGDPGIFKAPAINRIYRLSGGIPRLINILCDRALLGAYVHDSHNVTIAMVNQAADEIDRQLLEGQRHKRLSILLGCLLLSAGAALIYHWPDDLRERFINFLVKTEQTLVAQKRMDRARIIDVPANVQSEPAPPVPAAKKPQRDAAVSETDEAKESSDTADLAQFLRQPQLTLNQAFSGLLQQWGLSPETEPDCAQLPLNCLADQGTWRELVALNRPTLMEFVVEPGEKRYLLLIAVKNGQPLFWHQGQEIRFTLHEVLTLWRGDFLLLWQSPLEKVDIVYPKQQSPAVSWIRDRLDPELKQGGETTSGQADYFDPVLRESVRNFQQTRQLQADGIVGPRTMIHLQNLTTNDYGPRLQIND
nr:ExeA family protein [Methylomarinum sp. Ch1-1]MDP4522556.1 AAA family ATPase [Methylomarinum sp. Ch1-1]